MARPSVFRDVFKRKYPGFWSTKYTWEQQEHFNVNLPLINDHPPKHQRKICISSFFIEPESDHWECLSLTHSLTDSLTHSCLVNLIDVTLACDDDNSKLVEVVTVAHVDNEKRVDNSLVQIWKVIWS